MIQASLKRQTTFACKQDIFDNYRTKSVFSKLSDLVLLDYINSAFCKTSAGFELLYSPEWESLVYEYGVLDDPYIWKKMPAINANVVLIYGKQSNVCKPAVRNRLKKSCRLMHAFGIPGASHLVALEKPSEVANVINRII